MPEAGVWRCVKESKHKRKLIRHNIVIRSAGVFRSRPESAVAFIQVTIFRDIFKIFRKHPIKATFRPIRPLSLPQSVTRSKPSRFALQVCGFSGALGAINRESIGRIAE